jgi:anti-sigma regulatory factor (Ser/Thr protein kinase)
VSSRHLPLGILAPDDFNTDLHVLEMLKGDRLLFCSDGISEALNSDGEMFGEERMILAIENAEDDEEIFKDIQDAVINFMGDSERDDDITLVEVKMIGDFELQGPSGEYGNALQGGPQDWSMQYELGPKTLRDFNPLPLMLHIVMEVPGLRPYNGQIYTILAELFSNAMEHGVLGLKSDLKATAAGFIEYYENRTNSLETLDSGYVRFKFTHAPTKEGGVLTILLEDSGKGFDIRDKLNVQIKRGGYSGRGVPLIRSLCDSVEYKGHGNAVEVTYVWQYD